MSRTQRHILSWTAVVLAFLPCGLVGAGQDNLGGSAIQYHLSFPEPEHRWVQVDVLFPDLKAESLNVLISSASPGRYARHEFAKNLVEIEFTDGAGTQLNATQVSPSEWNVVGHEGTVRVRYRLFGDRVDGTYLGIDTTHAHMNMPATLLWARSLEDRAARLTFERPVGKTWTVATQLYPTEDPLVFTAPNLQYLMDSPTEFSDFALRRFTVRDPSGSDYEPAFRVAVHHDGEATALETYTRSIERIVRETVAVFGEFPRFETSTYTFIADYLPHASGDAMEHRNSTILTSTGPVNGVGQFDSVAHEFFHVWNVERIRPRSLEPFNFTRANVSGELWLAEGFTNYYGALVMQRTGLTSLTNTLRRWVGAINTITHHPGRRIRSAVEMSRLAPFTDAATAIDRTNWDNTFISYYTWGEAIGLGLDVTLRTRTNGSVTLDDYMRALWKRFGKPSGGAPGVVDRPYTARDALDVLGEVAGDAAFGREFFARYIDGNDAIDYVALLEHAGFVLRPSAPDQAGLGVVTFGSGMVVASPTVYGSPLHEAGVERDDVLLMLDQHSVASRSEVDRIIRAHRPGDTIAVGFLRRGRPIESTVTLTANPTLELVTVESTGGVLTAEQRAFRAAWLSSQQN